MALTPLAWAVGDEATPLLIVIGLVVGVATFALVLSFLSASEANRSTVQRRLEPSPMVTLSPIIPLPHFETISERARGIRNKLDRAGINLTVSEYLGLRVAFSVSVSLLVLVLVKSIGSSGTVTFIGVAIGFLIGYLLLEGWVGSRTRNRLATVEDQVLDALVSISKSLRSGLGLTQALEFAADECDPPLGPELQRAVRDIQLGAEIEIVFEDMNRRLGSGDLEIATTAMMIQRRVGGSLAEILSSVANTIRERRDIRAHVKVLTSRQRLTGNVSAAMPVVIALFFFTANTDVASLLVNTTAGNISLAVGIFFEVFGVWLIRKLSVVEV